MPASQSNLQHRLRPGGSAVPRSVAALRAAARRRNDQLGRGRLHRLHASSSTATTATSSSAISTSRCRPASPGSCAGSPTARRRRSRRRAAAGPHRAGLAELPGVEPDRDHERRRRPGRPPVPRHRQDVPGGPVQRGPAQSRRDHPGPRRPLRLRDRRWSGWRFTSTRSTPRCKRRLRHGAADHRRRSDPDAVDPGQHRPPELHDQPDQLRPLHRRLAGDRRPGDASSTSPPTSTPSTARTLGFKPKMTVRQLGGVKDTKRSKNPKLRFELRTRGRATPTSSRSR